MCKFFLCFYSFFFLLLPEFPLINLPGICCFCLFHGNTCQEKKSVREKDAFYLAETTSYQQRNKKIFALFNALQTSDDCECICHVAN